MDRQLHFSETTLTHFQPNTRRTETIFPQKLKNVAESFRNTVLPNIERQISKLDMLQAGSVYTVDYSEKLDYSIFLSKLGIYVDDCGGKYPVIECGSGIKSLTTIALHRTLGQIRSNQYHIRNRGTRNKFAPSSSKKANFFIERWHGRIAKVQAIISTHSTVVIDAFKP